MVRKIIIAIMVLVFLTGLCFFLYPYAQGALIDREIQENAEDFHSRIEVQPTTGNTSTVIIDTTEPTEEQLYPELWADMTAYNETIYAEGQSGLSCAYDYQKPSFTLKDYGLEAWFPLLLYHRAGHDSGYGPCDACICHRRRSSHRGQQPVRFHLRHDSCRRPDPAGLGYRAGWPVPAVPRSFPAVQWLPHSGRRYHHHLCQGDSEHDYRLIL